MRPAREIVSPKLAPNASGWMPMGGRKIRGNNENSKVHSMKTVVQLFRISPLVRAALQACFPPSSLFCARRSVGAVLLACLAAGCAGPRPTLKPEVVSTVNCTGVRGFLPQVEVNAQFILSGYGAGGGLIGAIVDAGVNSSRQRAAEKRVQELRERIRDVDFRGPSWQAISNAVLGISWLKADKFEEIVGTTLPPVTKQMAAQRAVLDISTDYYISQDCRAFVVSSGLSFFPPGKHGAPTGANSVAYHSAEIGKPDAEQAIALRVANAAAPFRDAVRAGILENAKLVRYALEYMGGAADSNAPQVTIRARLLHARVDYGFKADMVTMKGRILEDGAERLIFRDPSGQFFSLPRREVEVK
jgi:hypothetical protein